VLHRTPAARGVQYRGSNNTPREVYTFGPTPLTGDWTRHAAQGKGSAVGGGSQSGAAGAPASIVKTPIGKGTGSSGDTDSCSPKGQQSVVGDDAESGAGGAGENTVQIQPTRKLNFKPTTKPKVKIAKKSPRAGGSAKKKRDGEDGKKGTGCNCSRSKCLKLYCECFKADRMCNPAGERHCVVSCLRPLSRTDSSSVTH
jgi:hypothetical protein